MVTAELKTYRHEAFEAMGFTSKEADRLAAATETTVLVGRDGITRRYESPLAIAKVRAAIDAGCGHVQAVRIFA
jgi:hypothetical protein